MSVDNDAAPGDPRRLHGWTTPTPAPRERLLLALALAGILIWGFGGAWEYPVLEVSGARGGSRSAPKAAVSAPVAAHGDAAAAGAELFQANGCPACHALDGGQAIGPSLLGIFGETVELADGSAVRVDDSYLVESVLAPEAKRVAGYDDVAMPSYEGLVSTEDARALAEYIKRLE